MLSSIKNSVVRLKHFAIHLVTLLWWRLPIKRKSRKRIKDTVFSTFGFLLSKTRMYKAWQETNMLSGIVTVDNGMDYPEHWPKLMERNASMASPNQPQPIDGEPIKSIAIIIHAYYNDILEEILKYLEEQSAVSHKLFVTCPQDKVDDIQGVLKRSQVSHELLITENRGRDVLPFLKISKSAIDQGFNLFLKLHTKKSDHRMTGSLWRKEIFRALLPAKERNRIIEIFNANKNIGLLGPAGHIVPMNLYYGINAKGIGYLCRQLGVDTKHLQSMNFVAGSMFYIRKEALLPLLDLNMPDTAFEPESNQRDGTMAHAYERAFAISNLVAGFKLVDNKFDPKSPNPTVTSDHRFTW